MLSQRIWFYKSIFIAETVSIILLVASRHSRVLSLVCQVIIWDFHQVSIQEFLQILIQGSHQVYRVRKGHIHIPIFRMGTDHISKVVILVLQQVIAFYAIVSAISIYTLGLVLLRRSRAWVVCQVFILTL